MKFPEEFEIRMKNSLGSEWMAFHEAHLSQSPVSVRCNPEKHCPWTANPVLWTKYGHYLSERPQFTLDPLFHAGAYYVQDASSMFVEQAILQTVKFEAPLRILDLSAAPGGKSTHLLSLIRPEDLLVSNEVIRSRASILTENIMKWGYENCVVVNNDPSDFTSMENFFDVILVDAPCSGEGLFRKDPAAMSEWSPDNVALCSARQKRILDDIWPALKPGGVLIYSTCTYNEDENEKNLIHFVSSQNASSVRLSITGDSGIRSVENEGIMSYRFFPHLVNGEGFFLSVIRKNFEDFETPARRIKKPKLNPAPKKVGDRLRSWLKQPDEFSLFQHNDLVFAFRSRQAADLEYILERLRFVYAGVNMATMFHEKAVPEHPLALSRILLQENFPVADLSLHDALRFLKKDAITLPNPEKGYVLIRFETTPIGWANNLIQRVNNMYPTELKIRMDLPN